MFTFTRFFLAASMPLRIAMGTSRAFPAPYPTCPPASPTTTRAEKLMFLPPFTTLVTRLIDTTWSFSCNAFGSMRLATQPPRDHSELEPALARRIGQSFHPAMVGVTAAVEHGARDTQLLRALGQHLSHAFGCGDVGPVFQVLPHFLIARRNRDERMAAAVVHELRIDMARGPKNVQTRRLSAAASPLADSLMNPATRQVFGEQFQHISSGQWSVVSCPLLSVVSSQLWSFVDLLLVVATDRRQLRTKGN